MKKEPRGPSIDASLVEALLRALDARHGDGPRLAAAAALAFEVGRHLGLTRTDARALRAAVVLHHLGDAVAAGLDLPESVARLRPLAARLVEQAGRARD